jgi:hypothetical protein
MALLVDPPQWPGHGKFWSHLVSDSSVEELHAFAASLGFPPKAFHRDHYDIPSEAYETVVAAGAHPVSPRELVRAISAAGLRNRQSLGRQSAPAVPAAS